MVWLGNDMFVSAASAASVGPVGRIGDVEKSKEIIKPKRLLNLKEFLSDWNSEDARLFLKEGFYSANFPRWKTKDLGSDSLIYKDLIRYGEIMDVAKTLGLEVSEQGIKDLENKGYKFYLSKKAALNLIDRYQVALFGEFVESSTDGNYTYVTTESGKKYKFSNTEPTKATKTEPTRVERAKQNIKVLRAFIKKEGLNLNVKQSFEPSNFKFNIHLGTNKEELKGLFLDLKEHLKGCDAVFNKTDAGLSFYNTGKKIFDYYLYNFSFDYRYTKRVLTCLESFIDENWFKDDIFTEEFKKPKEDEKVVLLTTDLSKIIKDKDFQKELKKAIKYIDHAEKNPIKKTNDKVTVGYDEYTFQDKSIYNINVNRRNKKLASDKSIVFLNDMLQKPVPNYQILYWLKDASKKDNDIEKHIGWSFERYAKKVGFSMALLSNLEIVEKGKLYLLKEFPEPVKYSEPAEKTAEPTRANGKKIVFENLYKIHYEGEPCYYSKSNKNYFVGDVTVDFIRKELKSRGLTTTVKTNYISSKKQSISSWEISPRPKRTFKDNSGDVWNYVIYINNGDKKGIKVQTKDGTKQYSCNEIDKAIQYFAVNFGKGKYDFSTTTTPTTTEQTTSKDLEYQLKKHTKTGEDLHTVKMIKSFDRDEYLNLKQKAKAAGGYYSKYIKAFVFKTEAAARTFAGDQAKAPGTSPGTSPGTTQKTEMMSKTMPPKTKKTKKVKVRGRKTIYKKSEIESLFRDTMTECRDGTVSTSGSCNWHGGVKGDYVFTKGNFEDCKYLGYQYANSVLVPLEVIKTKEDVFQNRTTAFSNKSSKKIQEAVKNKKFKWELFDPILLFLDGMGELGVKNQLYVLSGHSRFAAFKKLSKDYINFKAIPAKIIVNISLSEAIEIALNSNTLATPETEVERASYFARIRQKGIDEKTIEKKLKNTEGANWKNIYAYSFLNPAGKAINMLSLMQESDDDSLNKARSIANWIGITRSQYRQLTNEHENEMYDFLFGGGYDTYKRRNDWLDKVNDVVSRLTFMGEFDNTKPLNLRNLGGQSEVELQYNRQLSEQKKKVAEMRKERNVKLKQLKKQGADQSDINRIIRPIDDAIRYQEVKLQELIQKKSKVQEAVKNQGNLFAVNGIRYNRFSNVIF